MVHVSLASEDAVCRRAHHSSDVPLQQMSLWRQKTRSLHSSLRMQKHLTENDALLRPF